ncbi:entericidin A/B family lipoprotein [Cognatilysobacter tabacisoli]|nr:entericidin A/B family lipoprotein [Lysobacter tabacisoli]
MKQMIKFAALLVLATVALGGCNTMEGLGKDVQKLGDKIEDKAAN